MRSPPKLSGYARLWAATLVLAACGSQTAQKVRDAAASDAKPVTAKLKLIDYNVQARPVLDDTRAAVNLPIIGGMLGEFGVADVEECFAQCEKLLAAAPQPHSYYFNQRQSVFSLANSGLAGVSWHPIAEVITTYYQAKAELADIVASKGVALMRIDVDGFAVDVYNTHMQAGDSDGAHVAQSAQADELVAFVTAHSPADRTVVLHGDFNMGPARPGKPFADFEPNHYSNEADMLARTASFQKVIDRLGLHDVSDVLFGPTRDHIERVLYREAKGVKVKPLSWEESRPEVRRCDRRAPQRQHAAGRGARV